MNYYAVTTRPFHVKDPDAFEEEMFRLGIWESDDGITIRQDGDGYRLESNDASFSLYDGDTDEEIDLLELLRQHLVETSAILIHEIAMDRGIVSGGVVAVTPTCVKTATLEDLETHLLANPSGEAIRQLAVSTVNNCGDVFYDPTEFGDPWGDPEEKDVEGATQRLLDWVTDNVEAGIRKALQLHQESGHVVVHVTPFESESGVLVDGQVVYIAPADSRQAMPANQVAMALAHALGIEVVEVDLRPEMEALIKVKRCDEVTWGSVPAMVAERLGGIRKKPEWKFTNPQGEEMWVVTEAPNEEAALAYVARSMGYRAIPVGGK